MRRASSITIFSGFTTSRADVTAGSDINSLTPSIDSKTDWAAVKTSSWGSGRSVSRLRIGLAAFIKRALGGEDLLEVPAQDLGEREQAEGLGGRGAVDHDHVVLPGSGMTVHLEKGEELVHPGEDEELLGLDAAGSAPIEHVHQLTADRAPVAVELALGVDLLAVEIGNDLARVGSQAHGKGIGERMGRVGGGDQCPMTGVGCSQRRAGGDGGLAHSSLAGDEDDPHAQTVPVTLLRSPRRAVVTIWFSACRRRKPGILKFGSTVSA